MGARAGVGAEGKDDAKGGAGRIGKLPGRPRERWAEEPQEESGPPASGIFRLSVSQLPYVGLSTRQENQRPERRWSVAGRHLGSSVPGTQ